MPKINFTKLDQEYKEYKKNIINRINKECNYSEAYAKSFTDTYTGWSPGVTKSPTK
tara:strand:+ start:3644 stop:3811 length:168 start_codon:yes stop_codon:yes gene_type:complete